MGLVLGNQEKRRHVLFTMLTACAWRDAPSGPAPVVAGLRTFLGGWFGIGRSRPETPREGEHYA